MQVCLWHFNAWSGVSTARRPKKRRRLAVYRFICKLRKRIEEFEMRSPLSGSAAHILLVSKFNSWYRKASRPGPFLKGVVSHGSGDRGQEYRVSCGPDCERMRSNDEHRQ